MASEYLPKLAVITVSSGSGSALVALGGNVIAFGIIPPSDSTVYDIEFADSDGFGLGGESQLTGKTTIYEAFQAHGTTTVTISNASSDGSYRVKIWFRE